MLADLGEGVANAIGGTILREVENQLNTVIGKSDESYAAAQHFHDNVVDALKQSETSLAEHIATQTGVANAIEEHSKDIQSTNTHLETIANTLKKYLKSQESFVQNADALLLHVVALDGKVTHLTNQLASANLPGPQDPPTSHARRHSTNSAAV